METLENFVQRFSEAIGCYSHLTQSGIYSLKKYASSYARRRNVFAWVGKRKNLFRIDTLKDLADKAKVGHLADGEKERLNWNEAGYFFFVMENSLGDDFKKAVRALNAIKEQIY